MLKTKTFHNDLVCNFSGTFRRLRNAFYVVYCSNRAIRRLQAHLKSTTVISSWKYKILLKIQRMKWSFALWLPSSTVEYAPGQSTEPVDQIYAQACP